MHRDYLTRLVKHEKTQKRTSSVGFEENPCLDENYWSISHRIKVSLQLISQTQADFSMRRRNQNFLKSLKRFNTSKKLSNSIIYQRTDHLKTLDRDWFLKMKINFQNQDKKFCQNLLLNIGNLQAQSPLSVKEESCWLKFLPSQT